MKNDMPRCDISTSLLVQEMLMKQYGITTKYEQHQIENVKRKIILEGLRLQKQ